MARNNINSNIRKAKTNYYKRYFKTNLGDIKKSWKGVNSIFGRNLLKTEINRIDVGNNSCHYPIRNIGPRVCFEDNITLAGFSFTLSGTHCGVVHRLVSWLRVDEAMDLDDTFARHSV